MSAALTEVPELPPLWRDLDACADRRWTPIPGGSMSWRIWGEGPPVVLIHGMHGSWTHWLLNIEALAASRTVIVPDLPGFGDSDLGELTTADGFGSVVADGLAHLGVTGALDILAFSFGNTISFHLPREVRARVRHLVLIGSAGLGPFRRMSGALGSWREVADPVARARIHAANLGIMMLADPSRIDAGTVALQMQNTERMTLRRKELIRTTDAKGRFDAWRPAAVDFIWGSEDRIIRDTLEETREIILGIVPDARFHVIEGAGHWVQYERADAVNGLLEQL